MLLTVSWCSTILFLWRGVKVGMGWGAFYYPITTPPPPAELTLTNIFIQKTFYWILVVL